MRAVKSGLHDTHTTSNPSARRRPCRYCWCWLRPHCLCLSQPLLQSPLHLRSQKNAHTARHQLSPFLNPCYHRHSEVTCPGLHRLSQRACSKRQTQTCGGLLSHRQFHQHPPCATVGAQKVVRKARHHLHRGENSLFCSRRPTRRHQSAWPRGAK